MFEPQRSKPEIRPVRDLRNNYPEIAALIKEHNPVFITNNGRGEAVIINIECKETLDGRLVIVK